MFFCVCVGLSAPLAWSLSLSLSTKTRSFLCFCSVRSANGVVAELILLRGGNHFSFYPIVLYSVYILNQLIQHLRDLSTSSLFLSLISILTVP